MISPLALALIPLSCLFGLPTSAAAQAPRPQPRLHRVVPPGGQAGTSIEVTVGGDDLNAADSLWFSRPGLESAPAKGKARVFRVAIPDGTSEGPVDVRVITPDGISNPRTFVVGSLPEGVEVEPNDTPASARPIRVNSVLDGTIGETDVDCFAFAGKKGQRVFVTIEAERIDSKLDATLRLLGPNGVELAESRDAFGADPFLDATLPGDGRYVIRLHDVTFAGSADHVYRLKLDDGPHLDAVFPPIAERGRSVDLTLIGRNLGGRPLADHPDGRLLEAISWSGVPGFGPTSVLPIRALGASAALRGFSPKGDVVVAESAGPVTAEREPNEPDHPQPIELPCSVGGTFGVRNDLDAYRFRAKKDAIWRVEAISEGIGSAADPNLLIQRVPDRGTGEPTDLVAADDTPDPGLAPRFNLASTDASIRWTVPADGIYQAIVTEVAGSSRGDPRLGYRFSIRREQPDFRLFLVPPGINVLDAVSVPRGGRAVAIVLAWRLDGFLGPILVRPVGLPEGVLCDPVVIPAGASSAPVVFEAEAVGGRFVGLVRLAGVSMPGYGPPSPGLDGNHETIAASLIWPPPRIGNVQTTIAPARATRGFAVAVRERSPFLLTAKARKTVVAAGESIKIEVSSRPASGFDETISLTGLELPPGWTLAPALLAKGTTSTDIRVGIPSGANPGPYSIAIKGTSSHRIDPSRGPTYRLEQPTNAVLVTVRPAPVVVKVKPGASVRAGGSASLDVDLVRLGKYSGRVSIGLEAPWVSKLSADPLTIGEGRPSGRLVIHAAADAPIGPIEGLRLRAEADIEGEAIEVVTMLGLTIEKRP